MVTPGGTCREVLVRREFDYLVDNPEGMFQSPVPGKGTREVPPSMRSVPPKLPDRQQPALADGAQPAGRKAVSGQLREADVAQAISNAGKWPLFLPIWGQGSNRVPVEPPLMDALMQAQLQVAAAESRQSFSV